MRRQIAVTRIDPATDEEKKILVDVRYHYSGGHYVASDAGPEEWPELVIDESKEVKTRKEFLLEDEDLELLEE